MNDGDGELLKIEIKRKGAEDDGKKKKTRPLPLENMGVNGVGEDDH